MTNIAMTGTTGSTFTVVAEMPTGRIGYRIIGTGFRVRVEPTAGSEISLPTFKQLGGGQNRFSIVVNDMEGLKAALTLAATALVTAAVAVVAEPEQEVQTEPETPYNPCGGGDDYEEEVDQEEEVEEEKDPSKMYGTSGAEFNIFGNFPAGRLGYRSIGGGESRVRVEPLNGTVIALPDWKQPDSDGNRYSTVVKTSQLNAALVAASCTLIVASL